MITYNDVLAATPNVIKRLKKLATFPNHGTVAGQAVASLFYDELNIGVSGPINDIDIFVSLSLPPEQRNVVHTGNFTSFPRNRTASNVTGMISESDDYSQIKFICARSNVTIFRTYQDGLRNFTLITHDECGDSGEQTLDVSQDIIRGFDLNLVGVGIHLESETPVVTPDFLEFLNHKTMKVVTCNTPTHTLIRLAKKAYSGQIVSAQCNFDEQRSMVETYLELVNRNSWMLANSGKTVLKVGEKYRAIATTYAQYLPPMKKDPNYGLYSFNPKSLRAEPVMDSIEDVLKINGSISSKVDFLLSYTFVANFPRVYERATAPDSQRWEVIRHAWNAANEMDDGVRLHNVSSALFNTPLIDPQLGIKGVSAATFVFNNTLTSAQREHTTHLYRSFSQSEKIIFHNKFAHIKHVQEFANTKHAHIESFVLTEGLIGLAKMSADVPSTEVHALMDQMFEALPVNAPYKKRIVNHLRSEEFINLSPHLFKHYEDKNALFEKLIKIDRVNAEQLNSSKNHVLSLAYFNGLWRDSWNDAQCRLAVENFFYRRHWLFENGWGEQPHHLSFVDKALNTLNDDQLFKHQSAVLRNILVPQHYDVVRERLMKSDQTTVLNEISEVSRSLTHEEKEDDIGVLWSKLVLDLNTVQLGASKSRRKM